MMCIAPPSPLTQLVVLTLMIPLVGCQRLPASVEGQVTYQGQPLTHGAVVFYPAAGGPAVHGQIDAAGHYALKTGTAQGLQTGDYTVTVMSRRGQPSLDMSPAQIDALDITPTRYRQRSTSDLRFTVAAGKNTIDIALHDAPPSAP